MKKLKQRVIDGFSTSQQSSTGSSVNRNDIEIPEILGSSNFQLKKTVRHGFPHMPSALAFDSVQRTLAIGTKTGNVRIFGKPGVDFLVVHDALLPVTHLQFIVNEGGLISVLEDSSIHLWNLRLKTPALVHSLKFNRERITCCQLPLKSKYFYVGTERGNVHVVNVDSFVVSGYQIQWNKAIGAARSNHPGPVVCISECPDDENKLLLAYENGLVILWDLKARDTDSRFSCENNIKSVSWHPDAKNFTCALHDGSLVTWSVRNSSKPASSIAPHALPNAAAGMREPPCRPICKVECHSTKNGGGGDPLVLFSGGLPYDSSCKHRPSLTVMKGKSVTVLEMEHYILDFVSISDSPYPTDGGEPSAMIALLSGDLVVIDLSSDGYPVFENPYPMDLHESPVHTVKYLADAPDDFIPLLYQVALKNKQRSTQPYSKLPWPISGGDWRAHNTSYPEIVLTGHLDGSIKFWDATAVSLQFLYKMKTGRLFEKNKELDEPHAVSLIDLDARNRLLAVAGNCGQILVYSFSRDETTRPIPVVEVGFGGGAPLDGGLATNESGGNTTSGGGGGGNDAGSSSAGSDTHNSLDQSPPTRQCNEPAAGAGSVTPGQQQQQLRVKQGAHKLGPGFQAELVVQVTGGGGADDGGGGGPLTALAVNAVFNLLVLGNTYGVCVVDLVTHAVLLNCSTVSLYSPDCGPPPAQPPPQPPASSKGRKSPKVRGGGPKAQDSFAESVPGSDDGSSVGGGGGGVRGGASDEGRSPPPAAPCSPNVQRRRAGFEQSKWRRAATGGSDKTDGSGGSGGGFSRSRSSSMSSLERADCSDAVHHVLFMNSYPTRADFTPVPAIWLGTSMSSVVCLQLQMPPPDLRPTQSVQLTNLGCLFSAKGAVISLCFLDQQGALMRPPADELDNQRKLGAMNKKSGTTGDEPDRQFLVISSDKEAKVVALPSHNVVFRTRLTETSYIVRADPILVSGGVCLACYVANGHIVVYSLPSLRPLLDAEYIPLTDLRIARTFCFSHGGQGLYLCSPSELQRITVSSEICEKLADMTGELHVDGLEMPEPPSKGLLKTLFSSATALDRDDLFGETSGKASKGLAKYQPGRSGGTSLDGSRLASGSAASEAFRAKQALMERGEKLSAVEDATAQMMLSAQGLSRNTEQLADKYKNKKWYQL